MNKYLLVLLSLSSISCGERTTSDHGTRMTVDPTELKFKKGDCLAFRLDSLTYGVGIVFDFSKDEGGIWYGLLLTDYESNNIPTSESVMHGRFLGRKIESAIDEKGFEIGIDTEYVIDSLLTSHFSMVGNLTLHNKIRIGAQGATSDMQGLIQKLMDGKERRGSPPDDYREYLTKSNQFRPDEYFDVRDFLER